MVLTTISMDVLPVHPIYRIDGETVTIVDKQYTSSYLPKCIAEYIKTLPDDQYIVGIGYEETINSNKKKKGGDAQIGITGHCVKKDLWDEKPIIAASRELGEEIGMLPTNTSVLRLVSSHLESTTSKSKSSNCNLYGIECLKLRTVTDLDYVSFNYDNVKDGNMRVAVVVYGNREDVVEMLMKKRNYINETDKTRPNDRISYYIAVSVKEAKQMCEMIVRKHERKDYKNFMWNVK